MLKITIEDSKPPVITTTGTKRTIQGQDYIIIIKTVPAVERGQCGYCFKAHNLSDLKLAHLRNGVSSWEQNKTPLCPGCRKYLHGNWRHATK